VFWYRAGAEPPALCPPTMTWLPKQSVVTPALTNGFGIGNRTAKDLNDQQTLVHGTYLIQVGLISAAAGYTTSIYQV